MRTIVLRIERKQADSASKEAELMSTKARLERATLEVSDCVLRSPFDGEIGRSREIGMSTVSLPAVKRAAHAVSGATVNDALLSIVAGAVELTLAR